MLTLTDTETETQTDKNGLCSHCTEIETSLGIVAILSVSLSMSVSVSVSVNAPLWGIHTQGSVTIAMLQMLKLSRNWENRLDVQFRNCDSYALL